MSLFSIRATELVLIIFLIPYLIIKIGVDNYGRYVLAFSLVMYFVNILGYGFDLSTVREIAVVDRDKEKVNEIFSKVFSVKIYLSVLVYSSFFILVFLIPQFSKNLVLYTTASFLILGELFSFRWLFIGIQKVTILSVINLFSVLIYLVLVLCFVNTAEDYLYVAFFQAIGQVVTGLVAFRYIIVKFQFKFQLLSIGKAKAYLLGDVTSFMNLLIPSVLSNTGVFLVGLLGVPQSATIMEIGIKFSNIFSTLNTIFTIALYPMVNKFKNLIKLSSVILIISGLLISILMFYLSGILIPIWIAKETESIIKSVVTLAKVLSITPFLMGVISAYGVNGLLVLKKDKLYSILSILVLFVCVLLSLILIPKYEFIGGAIALIIARLIYGILSMYFFKINK